MIVIDLMLIWPNFFLFECEPETRKNGNILNKKGQNFFLHQKNKKTTSNMSIEFRLGNLVARYDPFQNIKKDLMKLLHVTPDDKHDNCVHITVNYESFPEKFGIFDPIVPKNFRVVLTFVGCFFETDLPLCNFPIRRRCNRIMFKDCTFGPSIKTFHHLTVQFDSDEYTEEIVFESSKAPLHEVTNINNAINMRVSDFVNASLVFKRHTKTIPSEISSQIVRVPSQQYMLQGGDLKFDIEPSLIARMLNHKSGGGNLVIDINVPMDALEYISEKCPVVYLSSVVDYHKMIVKCVSDPSSFFYTAFSVSDCFDGKHTEFTLKIFVSFKPNPTSILPTPSALKMVINHIPVKFPFNYSEVDSEHVNQLYLENDPLVEMDDLKEKLDSVFTWAAGCKNLTSIKLRAVPILDAEWLSNFKHDLELAGSSVEFKNIEECSKFAANLTSLVLSCTCFTIKGDNDEKPFFDIRYEAFRNRQAINEHRANLVKAFNDRQHRNTAQRININGRWYELVEQ